MTSGRMHTPLDAAFQPAARPPRKKSRLTPVSVRFTAEERAQIEREAGQKSLSLYVRERLFGESAKRAPSPRTPLQDHAALAQVLSALGRSNLAHDFDALLQEVRGGSLPLSSETEAAIGQACADIAAIRRDLVKALGLKPE